MNSASDTRDISIENEKDPFILSKWRSRPDSNRRPIT